MKRSMILVNKPNSDWSSVIQSTEMLTDRSENVTKWQDYAILSHFSKQKRTTLSCGTYSCMLTPSNSNKEKMRLFWIPLCNSDFLCIFKELCKVPKLVVEGVTCDDLNQGELGNTWFVTACASLALEKKLFEKVFSLTINYFLSCK